MTEQKLEELLPCPLCKGAVEMNHIGNEHTKKRRIEIACKTFGCTIKYAIGAIYHDFNWIEGKIVKKWNTRASTARESELLALIETLIRQDTRSTKARTEAVKLLTNIEESKS